MILWKVRYGWLTFYNRWWLTFYNRWRLISYATHVRVIAEQARERGRIERAYMEQELASERKKIRELLTVLIRVRGFVEHPEREIYVTTAMSGRLFLNPDAHIREFLAHEIGRDVEQKVVNLRILRGL